MRIFVGFSLLCGPSESDKLAKTDIFYFPVFSPWTLLPIRPGRVLVLFIPLFLFSISLLYHLIIFLCLGKRLWKFIARSAELVQRVTKQLGGGSNLATANRYLPLILFSNTYSTSVINVLNIFRFKFVGFWKNGGVPSANDRGQKLNVHCRIARAFLAMSSKGEGISISVSPYSILVGLYICRGGFDSSLPIVTNQKSKKHSNSYCKGGPIGFCL